uniref:Uncharacterized protein n=1 Tax=Sphaerodactylus townsendi TaxID=933632 RepID=A0ACB8FE29_9SAUR
MASRRRRSARFLAIATGVALDLGQSSCTTLVQGKFFGYFSSLAVFPLNTSRCSWIIQNPDPRRYTLYMKVLKPAGACDRQQIRTYQFDSFLESTRTYLGMESFDDVLNLYDSSTRYAFLQSNKQFLQMKQTATAAATESGRGRWKPAKAQDRDFSVEYLVVGNRNPSKAACQMLCKWLDTCLATSSSFHPCGIMQTPCSCASGEVLEQPSEILGLPKKKDCFKDGIYLENCVSSPKDGEVLNFLGAPYFGHLQ